ncbi:MAG: hypothetical protein IIC07_04695, partial [Proteobacteria bacterium]|nr:hypothetical protein [Pseudomonadota bacterium]
MFKKFFNLVKEKAKDLIGVKEEPKKKAPPKKAEVKARVPSENKKDKLAGLEDTIASIQTKFGEGAIMKLGEKPRVDIDAISTGSIGLDIALGVGGLPRGRIIEIFGPESSGKT